MRIISGSARGRKLLAPTGLDTRPTTDRVKESVFNIINRYLPAKNVLDLFSGSGALGLECLSRASEHVVFIENDTQALDIIKKNLENIRLESKAEIIHSDALAYLRRTSISFEIIFLDPPYNTGLLNLALEEIHNSSNLAEDGIIVAESEYGGEVPQNKNYEIIKQAKYGKTVIFVLKHLS